MKRTARLISQTACEGIEEALGWTDAWQVRHGANWLVTRDGDNIAVLRLGDAGTPQGSAPVLFPDPTGDLRGYATPALDADYVVVCGDRDLAAIDADGTRRWTYSHEPWSADDGSGRGACAFTADGKHVIAVVPGPLDESGSYAGDLCVALDSSTGSTVAQQALTASSAIYEIRQPLSGPDVLLLSAGQGQDDAMSYAVSLSNAILQILPAGAEDEPVTGVDASGRSVLKTERGGAWTTLYSVTESLEFSARGRVHVQELAGEDSEERIVGRPGFIDDQTVIVAVAEEEWAEEARHFVVDARSLQISAELEYPFPVGSDPIALGDGTWITASGDEVRRWSIDTPNR
ncbi:hypothetical protein [Kitasatospora atroaurantiaca]|uniref:hypothetical protein n=1 Tax=Kitasatospora atroaurantiaca TaxID=285545 RepID=UPI00119D9DBC|nr:hypothetical protein [Kitasatospora atroaurantiaca]